MKIPSLEALGAELADLRVTLGNLEALLDQTETPSMLASPPRVNLSNCLLRAITNSASGHTEFELLRAIQPFCKSPKRILPHLLQQLETEGLIRPHDGRWYSQVRSRRARRSNRSTLGNHPLI